MGARRPNKKRNVLLVFELLTKEASKRLIAGDTKGSTTILQLIKKAFASGTELHREYRLANALLVSNVSSSTVATRIVDEARRASKNIDVKKLEEEKTNLIVEIERTVDSTGSLYEAQLPDYKLRSTIGTLLSDWRIGTTDIARQAQYENVVIEHLSVNKHESSSNNEEEKMSLGERRALISIMSRKLEERWGNSLNKEQKSLLREYALSKEPNSMMSKLNKIREEAVNCLDKALISNAFNSKSEYFTKRLEESKIAMLNRSFTSVDDESISLGLLYLKLIAESSEGEDK